MSKSALIDLSHVGVLCIDDDAVIRSVVRFALQRHGCSDVVQAHGGAEALEFCSSRGFDLLICDFQMSPMTGIDFLRELGTAGLGEGWPVIMLSAETDPAVIQEAHSLGVRSWVGKPVSAQALVDQVGFVLRPGGRLDGSHGAPELVGMADRHHARLMAALQAAEQAVQGLIQRPREPLILTQTLRSVIDEINERARTLRYGLLILVAERATDLVMAMLRNPGAAMHTSATIAPALGTLVTAMKRVGYNRMEGDGGEAGLKLLEMIDGIVAPARARLG